VLRIPDSKTDAGVRSVPLAPEFNRRLLRRRAAAGWATDADPIFTSWTGTPLDARNWRREVGRPAVEAADVVATPHTLRHSLASLLFERGHTAADRRVARARRPVLHAADIRSRPRRRRRGVPRHRARG
jgi:integrase